MQLCAIMLDDISLDFYQCIVPDAKNSVKIP